MSRNLEQLVGQLLLTGFRGFSVNSESSIISQINQFNLSGVILYDVDVEVGTLGSRNIKSPKQVKNLTTQLQTLSDHGLLIAVDQEGGNVNRLKPEYGFLSCPSWNQIGEKNNRKITRSFSKALAETLANSGINLNFSPVLDLDFGDTTVIGKSKRAVSSNPKTVVSHSKVLIRTLKEMGVISCGKHFPGLGSAEEDSHEEITDVSNSWTETEMQPFRKLIQSRDLDMIMVSHVMNKKLDVKFPASLSKNIITDLLRDELGFTGVIICDDPSMKAISNQYELEEIFEFMLNAGIDLFCIGNNLHYDSDMIFKSVSILCQLVRSNKISIDKIYESIGRINLMKQSIQLYD